MYAAIVGSFAISRTRCRWRFAGSEMSFASGIERRERADRAEQHPHRVRVVAEALEELRHALVDVGVDAHVVLPPASCVRGRQLPLEQQVGDLEEARLLGDLLDRVAAVAEDPRVAVDVGDRAPARGGVQERRIVREQPRSSVARIAPSTIGTV